LYRYKGRFISFFTQDRDNGLLRVTVELAPAEEPPQQQEELPAQQEELPRQQGETPQQQQQQQQQQQSTG
jgi:hypothetical protein